MKIIFLTLLLVLEACSPRPKRPGTDGKTGSATENKKPDDSSNSDPSNPDNPNSPGNLELEETAPIDSYLSVGTFLQKELDKPDNDAKTVKVFALIRQENSIPKNFESLKAAIANGSVAAGADLAQKLGFSSVEFEVDLASLKAALGKINIAVSSIEISGGTITE